MITVSYVRDVCGMRRKKKMLCLDMLLVYLVQHQQALLQQCSNAFCSTRFDSMYCRAHSAMGTAQTKPYLCVALRIV